MAKTIEDILIEVIADKLSVDMEDVVPDARFIEDLDADSLDTVELIMEIEERFGIEIPDEDAEKFTTVQDALEYIDKYADIAA